MGLPGAILVHLVTICGHLGPSWAILGLSWAFLGPSGAILGLLGAILGASWAVLGGCLDIVGPFAGNKLRKLTEPGRLGGLRQVRELRKPI